VEVPEKKVLHRSQSPDVAGEKKLTKEDQGFPKNQPT
jgi:hypothetical protein